MYKNVTQLLNQKQIKSDEIEVKIQCGEIKLKLSYIS